MAFCPCPRHCSCCVVLCLPQKQHPMDAILIPESKGEIWIACPKFSASNGWTQTKDVSTDRSSWTWPLLGLLSSAPETVGSTCFASYGKNCHSSPGTQGWNLDCMSKIQYMRGLVPEIDASPDKPCWPCPSFFCLSSAPETVGPCAFLLMENNCHSHPGVYSQNVDFMSHIQHSQGLLPEESCKDRWVLLALTTPGLPLIYSWNSWVH